MQTKTIEVSVEDLRTNNSAKLPPLMNPTMLEASDDLTNLSHLNEPAGRTAPPTPCLLSRCRALTRHRREQSCRPSAFDMPRRKSTHIRG